MSRELTPEEKTAINRSLDGPMKAIGWFLAAVFVLLAIHYSHYTGPNEHPPPEEMADHLSDGEN